MVAAWIAQLARGILAVALGVTIALTLEHTPLFGLVTFGVFAVLSSVVLLVATLRGDYAGDRRVTFLVQAALLHHVEEQRHVQRHRRNRRARLRDYGLEHRDARVAAQRRERGSKRFRGAIEILLRLAQRAFPVHGPRERAADVRVRHRAKAAIEQPL